MKFENPNYKLNDNNIFSIRQIEYESLLEKIRQIIIPAEEAGFELIEFGFKEPKTVSGELAKTIKKILVIKLSKNNHIIDLSMHVPKLIDDNYVMINGRKKIPFFQLYDIPIVSRGKTTKLRTNVATLMLFENKNEPFVDVSILGKKVPLALLLFAYFGIETIIEKYNILEYKNDDDNSLYAKLMKDLILYYEESKGYVQDDFIKEIGRFYSKIDIKAKGDAVIYALDLILKTDVISSNFFIKPTILEELVSVINGEIKYNDLDLVNKRIRCFEYVILTKVSKAIFDLCISNSTARQPKFNVNSQAIINDCNVSDIVQFDFAINPIQELTNLSRVSLVGPGGFNKQNVPQHLRDIDDSMFGRICSVDTPDRDNCGVLQSLIPNTKLDSNLRFTDEILDKQPISIPVSMVPFLEHDDQTRLQMSSSQMRQSIMLKSFDKPIVQSGCESLYTKNTQFVKSAKKDGEVIFVNNKYIIVQYYDKTIDLFNIEYRKIYTDNLDFMKIYVRPGDKFKQGDILAESNYCQNGHINFGRNLLTAVMIYYGYNYEDGIVISDRLVEEDIFTSLHYMDISFTIPPNRVLLSLDQNKYKPLPEVDQIESKFETIIKNNPYAILKDVPVTATDFKSIFEEPEKLLAKKNLIVTDYKIYANDWYDNIPEYKDWIESRIEDQKEKENELKKILTSHLSKDEANQYIKDNNLDITSHVGKYKIKGEKVNGIHVEMYALYTRKIKVGDKIGNRHGNKGVISRIVPHNKMPQLEDGRHVDICINPLGIISRMNVGQIFELHIGMAVDKLKSNILQMLSENIPNDVIKTYLIEFIKIIDNTENNWYSEQFINQLPNILDEKFINNFSIIQPPFESSSLEMIKRVKNYVDSKFQYKLYDPIAKVEILNHISVGKMYFFRMVHIAESKLAARGIGTYQRKTMQPLAGRKQKGGQRLGEMENACLIAHDSPINLFEFLTTKSDCIDLKNDYIRRVIDSSIEIDSVDRNDIIPESVKILNSYLTVIGIDKD